MAAYFSSLIDPALNWNDIEWLRSITSLPLIVKEIIRPDDALRVLDYDVSAIIISNHGGRQLDTAPATIEVLPEIVDKVAGRIEILVDGGVRRGTDVIKAIALGSNGVLIGRPVLWGLSVDGERGATDVLEILRSEIDLAMALCGCTKISDLSRGLVTYSNTYHRTGE